MSEIVLIPGTHGNLGDAADVEDWWHPGSEFASALRAAGHQVVSFAWSTRLDGLVGDNRHWKEAGKRLAIVAGVGWSIYAHSHGGQVAAYAAQFGAKFTKVFTAGTPVRTDVPYDYLRYASHEWFHLYGTKDCWWQPLGALGDGKLKLRRTMELADENIPCAAGHGDLTSIEILREKVVARL